MVSFILWKRRTRRGERTWEGERKVQLKKQEEERERGGKRRNRWKHRKANFRARTLSLFSLSSHFFLSHFFLSLLSPLTSFSFLSLTTSSSSFSPISHLFFSRVQLNTHTSSKRLKREKKKKKKREKKREEEEEKTHHRISSFLPFTYSGAEWKRGRKLSKIISSNHLFLP